MKNFLCLLVICFFININLSIAETQTIEPNNDTNTKVSVKSTENNTADSDIKISKKSNTKYSVVYEPISNLIGFSGRATKNISLYVAYMNFDKMDFAGYKTSGSPVEFGIFYHTEFTFLSSRESYFKIVIAPYSVVEIYKVGKTKASADYIGGYVGSNWSIYKDFLFGAELGYRSVTVSEGETVVEVGGGIKQKIPFAGEKIGSLDVRLYLAYVF